MNDIFIYDKGEPISRIIPECKIGYIAHELVIMAEASSGIHIVCDKNVSWVLEQLTKISGLNPSSIFFMEATEQNKTINTVLQICKGLAEHRADRFSTLLAIGGGITTDIAGFAASIYMRGINFAFIPTTLLAQIDAAIGGKNGVNSDSYKNMLGVIRQPVCTLISSELLKTLPHRDFLSGASEMIKAFLIEDGGFYGKSLSFLSDFQKAVNKMEYIENQSKMLSELISAAVNVKASIVSRDQFESGERRKLNLGHTFAHAIEKNANAAKTDITHGEAVAMGIAMAARLSEKVGYAQSGYSKEVEKDLTTAGLKTECPFPVHSLVPAMEKDKKSKGKAIQFVLVAGPGQVKTEEMTLKEVAQLMSE